ncbi:hypothetical protein BCR42DRAFT_408729 [Absidia repens]|uniref:SEC7 domain-containing protein n=1 Tax=Absidia repens TaxID=90262 RepID=A0A1X2IQ63_9FUNG|nr:hypothetical protein BCR42DRAFT_408729 [Absidia repens]
MLFRHCPVYGTSSPSLLNEMPTHCLDNRKTGIVNDIDHITTHNWIKRLKCFYKSKRTSPKQNFSTNETTSTLFNYKQDRPDVDSCFLMGSTTLFPLSAIDAEAIYQDASLSRSSSELPLQHSHYDATNKDSQRTTYISNDKQLPFSHETIIEKPETATVEQGTTLLPGDLAQGTRHQHQQHPQTHPHQHQQPDKKEIDLLPLDVQYALYSQHLRDSTDKLSLTPSSSSSSSSVSTASGNTQCSRIKYEKNRDADSSNSTMHSLYSTFATSTSNDIHMIQYMQPVPYASPPPEWSALNCPSSPRRPPPESPVMHREDDTQIPSNTDHPTVSDAFYTETLANDFWLGKQNVCEPEKVATWLGTNDPFRAAVLKLYMSHFDFGGVPLDEAFRKLCAKLFFKAESQQMDRIIEAFAKRYWKCNPIELYHSSDIVYAISYSLLLLNTDLHGVHEHHHKMKRARFVKNTMETISTLVYPNAAMNSASPPSITKSLSGLRLRKSKSQHSLATSYRSSSRPSPLHGDKLLFQQQTDQAPNDSDDDNNNHDKSDSNINTNNNSSSSSSSSKGMTETWGSQSCNTPRTATKSQSLADLSFYLKRRHSVMVQLDQTTDQKQWMANMELLLKDMYTSIKSREILRLSSSTNGMTSPLQDRKQFSFYTLANEARAKRAIRRKRGKSAPPASNAISLNLGNFGTPDKDNSKQQQHRQQPTQSTQSALQKHDSIRNPNHITTTTTSYSRDNFILPRTDYTQMEGWVMRKCLMQGTRQKAKQRNWIRCYLKIHDGKLTMQYHDRRVLSGQHWLNTIKHQSDDKISRVPLNKQDSFALNHSLSRILPPPGWHKQRTHVVCLQMTDGASWLFQVPSNQTAQDLMRGLNYQAARHSKEPLQGAVTNIDYGWNNNSTENHPSSQLLTWELPMSCMISSQLSTLDQLHSIHGYIERLSGCVGHHRDLRRLVEKRFSPRTANGMKAMTNWELKMQYLLFEKIKFQTYYEILAPSLVDLV